MIDLLKERRIEQVAMLADDTQTFNESAARALFENLPGFSENLAFNLDRMQPELLQEVVLTDAITIPRGILSDNEIIGLLMFVQENGFEKAKEPAVRLAINYVARKNPTTSFSGHMADVKKLGKVRPGIYHELIVDKLGAEDEPYSVFWLKSLMTAIYLHQTFNEASGEQFSRVPYRYFMFGAQGIGKSYALTQLSFGLEFDFTGDTANKDTKVLLSSNVLANADDTATQHTKLVDEIKSAITTPYYDVRLPYAKSNTRIRSRAVFVGSTNRHQAYTDTTGDRREMPIDLNVGMSEYDAELHGKKWVSEQVFADKHFFLDLWATYLHDYAKTPFDPSPYPHEGIDDRRREVISGHRRESDLTFIINMLLETTVSKNFADMSATSQRQELERMSLQEDGVTDVDPFTGDPSDDRIKLGTLPRFSCTAVIKKIKSEYGGKVSRATILEAMRDAGYREDRQDGRKFVRVNN